MRQSALLVCLLASLALLAACAPASDAGAALNNAPGESAVDTINEQPGMLFSANRGPAPAEVPAEAPVYGLETVSDGDECRDGDGTLLASSSYTWQILTLDNAGALDEAALARAEQNVETFNARFAEQFAAAKAEGEAAGYAREALEEGWTAGLPYSEEVTSATFLCGSVVTVRQTYYYNIGGAHPSSWVAGTAFDLTTGQFVAPVQLADDPAVFHGGAAELLIEKADALGPEYRDGYWQDYRDTIQLWDTAAAVTFDGDGMTVVFSPYDLGPYAMGFVELRLERAEIADLLGPGGLEKLGWTETPEE